MIQEDLQGPLDKYIVKCIGCAETVEVFEVPGQFTNLTISYLDKDAEYSFFVSVATDKGLNDTAEPDILMIPKHSEGNCVNVFKDATFLEMHFRPNNTTPTFERKRAFIAFGP